jgi:1-acyl-sn-glycerol-3-phosphate acyltransferase
MIKARHHWLIAGFFDRYIDRILKKDFHSISVEGEWKPVDKGSLIIGNHISWWDGFFAIYLNNRFLKKRFHLMLLEEQLNERKFFAKAGAFSINPGSRDVVESLRYAASLLNQPDNSVLVFPQGILHSLYNPTFTFERGIEKILRMAPQCQLLFYAIFVEYFSQRKPSLFYYLKEVEMVGPLSKDQLQELYQSFYNESLTHHSQLKV